MCSELYEMVKNVAETLEMVYNGAYRCHYCGTIADDDMIICPDCGKYALVGKIEDGKLIQCKRYDPQLEYFVFLDVLTSLGTVSSVH